MIFAHFVPIRDLHQAHWKAWNASQTPSWTRCANWVLKYVWCSTNLLFWPLYLCECSNYLKLLVGISNFNRKVIETLLEWNLFWIVFDVKFWGSKAFVPWGISLIHWPLLLPSGNVSLWSINMKRVIFTFWRKFR